MKRKYAGMYYQVKKTNKGFIWNLFFEYKKGSGIVQSSLENDDDDDKYLETETAARSDAVDAIQYYYN